MLGTIVNYLAIIAGGLMGLKTAFVSDNLLVIIIPLASGLSGNHAALYPKLDGIVSIILNSSMELGVLFSTDLPGGIHYPAGIGAQTAAGTSGDRPDVRDGGLCILGIGMNMLRGKKIKVGNMLTPFSCPWSGLGRHHICQKFKTQYPGNLGQCVRHGALWP